MTYLHLIRFKDLLLLAFTQLLFRFGFLKLNNVELALTNLHYFLLVLASVLIAAGGFVIYYIFDRDLELTNPKKIATSTTISENLAYNLYFGLNSTGVCLGYYLSNAIQRPSFLVFFILIVTLLYLYASQLKQIPLLGTTVVAVIISFSILIIGFFDLFPATDAANKEVMRTYFSILADYALMAFLISLLYQIIVNLRDFKKDTNQDYRTFADVLGLKKTIYFVALLNLLIVVIILLYISNYVMENELYFATFYILLTIIAPLIYILIRIFSASSKSDFEHLIIVLKWVFFLGVLSLFIISKNIIYNVIK